MTKVKLKNKLTSGAVMFGQETATSTTGVNNDLLPTK